MPTPRARAALAVVQLVLRAVAAGADCRPDGRRPPRGRPRQHRWPARAWWSARGDAGADRARHRPGEPASALRRATEDAARRPIRSRHGRPRRPDPRRARPAGGRTLGALGVVGRQEPPEHALLVGARRRRRRGHRGRPDAVAGGRRAARGRGPGRRRPPRRRRLRRRARRRRAALRRHGRLHHGTRPSAPAGSQVRVTAVRGVDPDRLARRLRGPRRCAPSWPVQPPRARAGRRSPASPADGDVPSSPSRCGPASTTTSSSSSCSPARMPDEHRLDAPHVVRRRPGAACSRQPRAPAPGCTCADELLDATARDPAVAGRRGRARPAAHRRSTPPPDRCSASPSSMARRVARCGGSVATPTSRRCSPAAAPPDELAAESTPAAASASTGVSTGSAVAGRVVVLDDVTAEARAGPHQGRPGRRDRPRAARRRITVLKAAARALHRRRGGDGRVHLRDATLDAIGREPRPPRAR